MNIIPVIAKRTSRLRALGALVVLIGSPVLQADPADPAAAGAEPEAVVEHVRRASALAGRDLTAPLFLCRADSTSIVKQNLESGAKVWLDPVRLFDDLYYVGNRFVGVLVLRTTAGLILFDSSSSADEVREHLVPGLRSLGLDPATIKYVVVTHGHWDHFGGAKYLQATYGARIALSSADWDLIERQPAGSLELSDHPIPVRDVEVTDGQRLTLGDTTVTLYLTPGHTPGTVSAILPVRLHGRTVNLSLYGSVAFPPTIGPTPRTGGLRLYDESVQRFARISREADAQGIVNTHVFADGTLERIESLKGRKADAPSPFLTGPDYTARYYGLLHECLAAAQLRPEGVNDWSKPAAATGTD